MLHILKFGGTTLANAERISRAAGIVQKKSESVKVAVVVSALGGVTDELIAIMDMACSNDKQWLARFGNLRKRHYLASEAVSISIEDEDVAQLSGMFRELESHYRRISEQQTIRAYQRDLILSFGERFSCRIFAAALRKAGLKARVQESQHFIRTNARFGDADVDSKTTLELIGRLLAPVNGSIPVITGFIGATAENEITTLGRSGSDYTAGLIGEALKAEQVEIWTDVNGVLTADPNIAPTAVTIPRLHYSEIAEMAHFGTKVLHPRTVLPLELLNIPIRIKNSFDPDAEGTLITKEFSEMKGSLKSVSLKKDINLISIKSRGLDRISDLASRALRALSDIDVKVYYNAAPSAEYGLSLVVNSWQAWQAAEYLTKAFQTEFDAGLLEEPQVYEQVSMVTVIGELLEHDLGLSGAVLSLLGENNIAPLTIAKSVANRHLSLLVRNNQAEVTVRLLNDHFCVHARRLRLFIAGLGTIGGELVRQIGALKKDNVDLSIIGACNSKKSIWNSAGLAPESVFTDVEQGKITDWEYIVDHLIQEFPYRTVFVDATGSAEVARLYGKLLKAGIHIATPSKRANTMEQSYFDELMSYTKGRPTHYLFETTCGAGLPIIQTINDLLRSGDEITRISGVVSGTMTFIFDQLEKGKRFGDVVKEAKEAGYSEPDPRDDLSGEDVARKFMTLARACGIKIERDELEVENLTPEVFQHVSLDEFLNKVSEYDDYWQNKVAEAASKNEVLRYVGELHNGKIKVGVQSIPKASALGALSGADNQVAIYTNRYATSPMIVQGPGAGKEVTAAGLLSDIQKITRRVFK